MYVLRTAAVPGAVGRRRVFRPTLPMMTATSARSRAKSGCEARGSAIPQRADAYLRDVRAIRAVPAQLRPLTILPIGHVCGVTTSIAATGRPLPNLIPAA